MRGHHQGLRKMFGGTHHLNLVWAGRAGEGLDLEAEGPLPGLKENVGGAPHLNLVWAGRAGVGLDHEVEGPLPGP